MFKNAFEIQYLEVLRKILDHGDPRLDRTGVGTKSLFGQEIRWDLNKGFPIITTKQVYWKTAFKEILWMISGSTSLRDLLKQNVSIWTAWPLKNYREKTNIQIDQKSFEKLILSDDEFNSKWGELTSVYGKQWRRWLGSDGVEIDQIQNVINLLKTNPFSRRIIWEGWKVDEIDKMPLPPCHKQYQFYVNAEKNELSCACIQRSADAFLGLPFNICNLALICHMMAQQTGYKPGEIVWYGLDTHIYTNHFELVKEQLKRSPRDLPALDILRKPTSFFDYKITDLQLVGYLPHPPIAGEVAV